MKRDLDLVRTMLNHVKDTPPLKPFTRIEVEGYDQPTIIEHLELLIEANLIKGQVRRHSGGAAYTISRLTWDGQDFLDAAKNDSVWNRAKKAVIESSKSFTFGLLRRWLEYQAGQALGMPFEGPPSS